MVLDSNRSNAPSLFELEVATLRLEDYTPEEIGSFVIEDIRFEFDDDDGRIINTWGSYTQTPIKFDFRAYLALLDEMPAPTGKGAVEEDIYMDLMAQMSARMNIFSDTSIVAEDIYFAMENNNTVDELFNVDRINIVSEIDIDNYSHTYGELAFEGLNFSIDAFDLDESSHSTLTLLVGDTISFDGMYSLDLVNNPQASVMELSFGGHDMLYSLGEVHFILPSDLSLQTIFESASNSSEISENQWQAWAYAILLDSVEVEIEDMGLLPKALALFSRRLAESIEVTLEALSQMMKENIENTLPLNRQSVAALDECLRNPGTLNVATNFAEPMGFTELLTTFMTNPLGLNISAMCTPGDNIINDAHAFMLTLPQEQNMPTENNRNNNRSSQKQ